MERSERRTFVMEKRIPQAILLPRTEDSFPWGAADRQLVPTYLEKYGYENTEPEQCLALLKKRFEASEDFPHEIGIFLDYPLGDVIGFIQNGGQNYKCSGCWKVYCNECEALKMFQKYHKCREVYRNLWAKGRSVLQLTVAA